MASCCSLFGMHNKTICFVWTIDKIIDMDQYWASIMQGHLIWLWFTVIRCRASWRYKHARTTSFAVWNFPSSSLSFTPSSTQIDFCDGKQERNLSNSVSDWSEVVFKSPTSVMTTNPWPMSSLLLMIQFNFCLESLYLFLFFCSCSTYSTFWIPISLLSIDDSQTSPTSCHSSQTSQHLLVGAPVQRAF